MKIRWTRRALRRLNALADFLSEESPDAAARMLGRIDQATSVLVDNPAMGRAGRVPGVRELVVAGTPYIVPYRVRDGEVEILTVFHAHRRPPPR